MIKLFSLFSVCTLVMGSLALSGCGSSETHYYRLSPIAGKVVGYGHAGVDDKHVTVLEVRMPSIVASLDRDSIVYGSRDYLLDIEAGAAWSEPPAEMVGHTLVADLSQRLPGTVVFAQNDAVISPPQVFVELSISRFERDEKGYAVIEGVLSVHKADEPVEKAVSVPVQWVSKQPVHGGAGAFSAALSHGVGSFADCVVNLLQR